MSTNPNDLKMSEFPLAGPIDLLTDYVAIVRLVSGVPQNLLAAVTDIQKANVPPTGGGGGGAVDSVFGRVGNVLAQGGDYSWGQIAGTTLPIVSGVNVTNLNASALASGTVPDAVLVDSGVAPASYANASITVDAKGRVTAAASGPTKAAANPTVGVIPYLSAANVFSDSPMIRENANTISFRTGAPTALRMYKATTSDPGGYLIIDNRNDAGGTPRWIIQGTANAANPWDNVAIGSGGNSMVFGDSTMYPVANGGVSSSVGTTAHRVNNFYAWNTYDVRMGSSFDWTGFFWNGNTRLISYAAGSLSVDGWTDNTAGSRLLFGTQTNTAPMLKRNATGLEVKLADDSGYTGVTTGALRVANSGTVYADLTMSAGPGGILTINSTGLINFSTVGNQIDPAVGYEENLGSLQKKYLGIYAAELWVETLVAQDTVATIGGRVLVGPTTILTADAAPTDTTINVKHNQISSVAPGDVLVLQAAGKLEFMLVTAGPTGAGPYTYTVTRNLDGSGANQWFAGDAVFNTGRTGVGFIDLYSFNAIIKTPAQTITPIGPTIVGNVRNSQTYNDWSEHWAIGNLSGVYGYGATTYGVGLGKYAAGATHVTIDATAGLRMFSGLTTVVGQWANDGTITLGSPVRIQFNPNGSGSLANGGITWDTAGNINITGTAVIGGAVGGWTIATSKLYSTGVDLNSGTNAGLAFGTTPPTSSTPGAPTGTGVWLDRTGLYGLAANVVQVKVDATTGKFIAGNNAVIIDPTGITIQQPNAGTPLFRLADAGVRGLEIRGSLGVNTIQAFGNATNAIGGGGGLIITALNSAQTAQITLNLVNQTPTSSSAQLYANTGTFGGFTIGGTGTAAAPSAVLDLQGTTGALLLSRLTQTQRDALTPTDGMVLYNATLQKLNVRAAGYWLTIDDDQSVKLSHSAAQACANAAATLLTWDTEIFDAPTPEMHSSGFASGIIIRSPGVAKYLVTAVVTAPPATAGVVQLQIRKNRGAAGDAILAVKAVAPASASQFFDVDLTCVVALANGDYIEAQLYQTTGAAINLLGNPANNTPLFTAIKIN